MLALVMMINPPPVLAVLDTASQAEPLYLFKHDCGSAHGMARKGVPGWPAGYSDAAVARVADRAGGALAGGSATPGTGVEGRQPILIRGQGTGLSPLSTPHATDLNGISRKYQRPCPRHRIQG